MKDETKEIKRILATSGKYITYAERCYVLDYITNLQEENKRLKELCDKYEEEHSTTFEYWKQLIKEDYKSRCEKALDKLYCYGEVFDSKILQQFQKEMENVLQGEDKDE